MAALAEALQACRGCELHRDATQAVPGRGAHDARLVLLGEQPGDREDQEGMPFVGPAGRLLVEALGQAGLDPAAVYRTNVVKHFRWSGTRGKQRLHKSPAQAHVRACAPWLVAELGVVRPEGVVLLGGTAGKAVYGASFRVGESRGRLLEWPEGWGGDGVPDGPAGGVAGGAGEAGDPPWVVATTHPAAVLRADPAQRDDALAGLVADLRLVADQLR
nr:UdgX family uracil-DNA binding protein [Nocardioides perillae]